MVGVGNRSKEWEDLGISIVFGDAGSLEVAVFTFVVVVVGEEGDTAAAINVGCDFGPDSDLFEDSVFSWVSCTVGVLDLPLVLVLLEFLSLGVEASFFVFVCCFVEVEVEVLFFSKDVLVLPFVLVVVALGLGLDFLEDSFSFFFCPDEEEPVVFFISCL